MNLLVPATPTPSLKRMGTREVYEEKLRNGNLHFDPTLNPGVGSARCPRCLSLLNPNSVSFSLLLPLPPFSLSQRICFFFLLRTRCLINWLNEIWLWFLHSFVFRKEVNGLSLPFCMMPPPSWVPPLEFCFDLCLGSVWIDLFLSLWKIAYANK